MFSNRVVISSSSLLVLPVPSHVRVSEADRLVQVVGGGIVAGTDVRHRRAQSCEPPQCLTHDGFRQAALPMCGVGADWFKQADAIRFVKPDRTK